MQAPTRNPTEPGSPRTLRRLALVLSVLAGGLLAAPEASAQTITVDAEAKEGEVMTFVITVRGFHTRDNGLRYSWRTRDVTATAGTDYEADSGTVSFVPSSSRRGINIKTIADGVAEGGERFELELYDRKVKGGLSGDTTWRTSSDAYPAADKLILTGRILDP